MTLAAGFMNESMLNIFSDCFAICLTKFCISFCDGSLSWPDSESALCFTECATNFDSSSKTCNSKLKNENQSATISMKKECRFFSRIDQKKCNQNNENTKYTPRSNRRNAHESRLIDCNWKLYIFLNNQRSPLICVGTAEMIRCHCRNFVEKMCRPHEQSTPFHYHSMLTMKMIVDAYGHCCYFHPNRLADASRS